MSPLPCISSLPSIHVFLLQNEACLSMLLTQRQGRIKKSGKEEEDSTWLKRCMYCWDYAWTTGWTEGEKDEDKCHDHSPGQHHISVVHLEIYTKEKRSLHWASLPFQLRGQEKVRKQRCQQDMSSWKGPSSGCQVRVCAELETLSCPWSTASFSQWCLH